MSGLTPAQTIGPFAAFILTPVEKGKHYPWTALACADLVTADASGERIRIEGRVINGEGAPHRLTLLEFWQADGQGHYAHPRDGRRAANTSFKGFGRTETDSEGRYAVDTIKPGRVPGPNGGLQAPHIVVAIHSPFLLRHLCSRIYFADETANADDPILGLVPAERRDTLLARKEGGVYRLDFVTQGGDETVFFDF